MKIWKTYILLFTGLILLFGCATVHSGGNAYYLSEQYFIDVRNNEDPLVMDYFFRCTEKLSEKNYESAIENATRGMDNIPKYKDMFAFFYGVRGYSYIMLYQLEKAKDDITNIETLDKDSVIIPFLDT